MEYVTLQAFRDEMSKTALLERLVRLGATDIPGTPRMLMKKRSPQELSSLQKGVEGWWNKRVTNPIMNKASPVLNRLPEGKVKRVAEYGAKALARDPVGTVATEMIPVPGAGLAYQAGKRGLEKIIDKVAPLHTG